jgi:hypothetical protein
MIEKIYIIKSQALRAGLETAGELNLEEEND